MTQRIDIWVESAGLGHVTRQINLFEHLRACGADLRARFIIDERPATAEALRRAGHDFVTRDANLELALEKLRDEWVQEPPGVFVMDSVDHDLSPKAKQLLTSENVTTVVFMDDPGDRDVECDIQVNALPARSEASQKTGSSRSLRGVEYLILPPEYAHARKARESRPVGKCERGFVFFGGADLENFTTVFLDAVARTPRSVEWTLLMGPAFEHSAMAERRARDLSVSVSRHVDSMAEALLRSDIAVLAAGNTLSEAAATGTPAIALSQNPVQRENALFFTETCGVLDLGGPAADLASRLAVAIEQLAGDVKTRSEMSGRMLRTVDGLGGRRVADVILAEMNRRA